MDRAIMNDLVNTLVPNAEAEDLMLAGLQAMIASEITIRRQEMDLTQAELAEMMHVSQGLVSRWENGDSNFTLKTLVDIASKLGIEMQSPFRLRIAKAQYIHEGKVTYLKSADAYRSSGRYIHEDDYTIADASEELKEM